MKINVDKLLWLGVAFLIILFAASFYESRANASPLQCTFEQPYPNSPYNICTGYGTFCPRSVCAYEPGTPGRFDINGDYEPRMG